MFSLKRTISSIVYASKVRRDKRYGMTLADMLSAISGDKTLLNVDDSRLKLKVEAVSCTNEPWFRKNSICVQMPSAEDGLSKRAVKLGASVIISDHEVPGIPNVIVKDTRRAFSELCGIYRSFSDAPATIVTGSIGKTTTKLMVNSVYAAQYNTFCQTRNANKLVQCGHFVQHIGPEVSRIVQEVTEHPSGTLTNASRMYRPNVVVLTAMDKSHIEAFGSQEAIAKEICSAADFLSDTGCVIVNKDEFDSYQYLEGKRIVTVGMKDKSADYYADEVEICEDGIHFCVVSSSKNLRKKVTLNNIYAVHNVISALSAFAAGMEQGEDPDNIVAGLEGFHTFGIRQSIFRTKSGVLVYADCYNAVAKSIESAIKACESIPVKGKRIAVIGDIEEAGDFSDSTHDEVIGLLEKSQFDIVLLYGKKINAAYQRRGTIQGKEVVVCATHQDVITAIKKLSRTSDLVLFKSSHSGHLENCMIGVWPESKKLIQEDEKITRIWKYKQLFG